MDFIRNVTFMCFVLSVASSPHGIARNDLTKERVEDGAHVARDSKHYVDGQHRSEFDHEAIIGSHNEVEEFRKLSEDEAKKRLEAFFHKKDTNGDKFIDKLELIQWVLDSFKTLTLEEAQERLEDDDENEDGKVTWEEHLQETFGNFDEEYASDADVAEEQKLMRDSEELFNAADVNKDGFLDKEEYPAFSHPEEFDKMHDLLYMQIMREKDRDGDGFISTKEFTYRPDANDPYTMSTDHLDEDNFKRVYDLDSDGMLNREEVLHWIIPNNEEAATNEAEHLIQSADGNNDRKLSLKEFLDNHDTFVGSEITGYGEQLKDEL